MYKVLIVDDEKMIRMGIQKVIPWEDLGVGEVFTASSAREALKILEEHTPEIMITDIHMSEMTGLELIEAAKEFQPKLRVLVLTGYDSFEYARQSLRLKVQDFFLKPADEKDLSHAVREQVAYLRREEEEAKSSLLVQRTRGVAEQMRLETYMRNLIHRREGRDWRILMIITVRTGYMDSRSSWWFLLFVWIIRHRRNIFRRCP